MDIIGDERVARLYELSGLYDRASIHRLSPSEARQVIVWMSVIDPEALNGALDYLFRFAEDAA